MLADPSFATRPKSLAAAANLRARRLAHPRWKATSERLGTGFAASFGFGLLFVANSWAAYARLFEAVLQGELLLPHWRFEQGINLQAMLDNPQPYSPALILQGTSVLPYLEEGEIASPETLEPVVMILGADFFTYAIWFN